MIEALLIKPFGSIWKLKKLCQNEHKGTFKKFYITIYNWYLSEKGSFIAWNSRFKGEPLFPHGLNGIFVSGAAIIGKNCIIFQQVTIGSNTLPDSNSRGAPIIGDNCYFGAGAKVIGNVRLGNNVRVGANAIVYKDVPDNSIVTSGEQVNIEKNQLDNKFYKYSPLRKSWVYFDSGKWETVKDIDTINRLKNIEYPG